MPPLTCLNLSTDEQNSVVWIQFLPFVCFFTAKVSGNMAYRTFYVKTNCLVL